MKGKWTYAIVALLLLAVAVEPGQAQGPGPQGGMGIQAALGTAFTYQGQLKSGGNPANGNCDLEFSLWDAASGGTQVGSTQTSTNVSVSNGLFTTILDFGSTAFQGDARWLEIAVRCPAGSGTYTTLNPRQALTAAPYALSLRPGAQIIGDVSGSALYVRNTSTSGATYTYGVRGRSDSTDGTGVYGLGGASSGPAWGVYGKSNSLLGRGVYGEAPTYGVYGRASATNIPAFGVYGDSNSTAGTGVYGYAGTGRGVTGVSDSTAGTGVYGSVIASSGTTYGVRGRSDSTDGYGVYGWADANSGTTYGVYGRSDSTDGRGVFGWATASSGDTYGVYGYNPDSDGTGVFGYASANTGPAWGVSGRSLSTAGRGVVGVAEASSGTNFGVYGLTTSATGYAGYFEGRVQVTGNFSAGGSKAFKIDHPLNPANRYLYHFAREGPEVQNVYNGVVTLDANGEAVVTLPAYFSTLNAAPFRYQLTPIGVPMSNLYIAEEIEGNTFTIAGGVAGGKVSWKVTAVRHDPYLRDHPVQAEVDKPVEEQGTYLYPEGYGQPREMGLDYQRNADLLERMPESPSAGDSE